MTRLSRLIAFAVLTAFIAACNPPAYDSAHPDALRAGPFWQREEQRD